jgi:hypothetical protein
MLEGKQERLAKRMRWAARIIGLATAGLLLISLIAGAIVEAAEGWEAIEIAGILLVLLAAMALAGCIVSWWRERLAGILLILAAVGMGIHIGVYAERNHFLVWLMLGLPYLIAGVLFLTSWRLSRKTV